MHRVYTFTQKNDSQCRLIYLQEVHMKYQTIRTMALFAHMTYYPLPPPKWKQKLRSLKAYQCDDLDWSLVDIESNATPPSVHW